MYWNAIEPYWDALDLRASPDEFATQFAAIPPLSQHLFAAYWAFSEVRNGALPQFFSNSTGILAPEAVVGLRALGLPLAAEALEEGMKAFGQEYPRLRSERAKTIECVWHKPLSSTAEALLDNMLELTDQFLDSLGKQCKEFEIRANAYYVAQSSGA